MSDVFEPARRTQMSFGDVNAAFPSLLSEAMYHGKEVESRNGRTKELFMQQVTLRSPASDPYLTTPGRNISLPAQIAETMWVLAGRNDVEWLSHYLPRAKDFSDDGETWRGGYGPRIRNHSPEDYGGTGVDQLAHVVKLLQEDPDTRRAVISIYDPEIDTEPGKDIPCNDFLHFLHRDGKLHLHVFTRSNDLMWGWSGINAFEWTALLSVVSQLTHLGRGSITFSVSSLHLYERHWEKAQKLVNSRNPLDYNTAPRLTLPSAYRTVPTFDNLVQQWFTIEDQIRSGVNKGQIRLNIEGFPEPMMRSWLEVLHDWHWPDQRLTNKYQGTSLHYAFQHSPKLKKDNDNPLVLRFVKFLSDLHAEKHRAYGNSWKKRGEMLGIMANIARKVDRLGVSGGGDTSADTAMDLLAYLIKYELWLKENVSAGKAKVNYTEGSHHEELVTARLEELGKAFRGMGSDPAETIDWLKLRFDELEPLVEEKRVDRVGMVSSMIPSAFVLAFHLWVNELKETPQRVMFGSLPASELYIEADPEPPLGENPPITKEQWQAANEDRRWKGYEV